jgi:uncharacterized membrane protein
MIWLVLGLILFAGTHLSSSQRDFRTSLISRFGENGHKGLFTLGAVAGIVLMSYGYGAARAAGPSSLWFPPVATRHIALLLLLPVFPMLFAGTVNGVIKAKVKHPMLTAVKLWAVAHLVANGTVPDVLLFGGLLAWAVAERIALKRRGIAGGTANPSARADLIPVVFGVALYVAMLLGLHLWLIGVSPI